MKEGYYKWLFLIAAIYDIFLGIIFMFFYKPIFSLLGIPLPNFTAYISLLSVFLIVLGIGYYYISKGDLRKNRDLIKVGTLYKFAYSGVALFYLIIGALPHLAFALVFGVADLIFGLLFIECLYSTKKRK